MKRARMMPGNGNRVRRSGLLLSLCAIVVLVGGCEVDSFMDPSEVGRWENTPVVLPILNRLDVIEDPVQRRPGVSDVRSEDLIPEVSEYVLGPGDMITVTVYELINRGQETVQSRQIDQLGYIRLPVIGEVEAAGLTPKQLEDHIADILDPQILRDPMVTVVIQRAQQRTFKMIGPAGSGTYTIQENNFRLLDALALSQGVPSGVEELFVIRQIPLSDVVEEGYQPEGARKGRGQPGKDTQGGDGSSQGGDGSSGGAAQQPSVDPGQLIESLSEGEDEGEAEETTLPNGNGGGGQARSEDGGDNGGGSGGALDAALESDPGQRDGGRFINVNGEWVWVKADASADASGSDAESGEDGGPSGLPSPEELVTQRVIGVDAEALLRGDARENIVIRPGDTIRIPDPQQGNIYIGGSIARPGTYSLPLEGRLTLTQAIISAGGLSAVGIPERVDLIRRVDGQREATVRLNLRAIFEGVQPNIFMKPNDTVNIGTNLYASHAAVLRNSFRASYGFGFLLDRNFGSDVFGVTPDRASGGGGF